MVPNSILEIELMLQWSTSTYKSLCCTVEEEFYHWQATLPREGLQFPFLLHGFFAMASLEIATKKDQPQYADYVSVALEYHDSALSVFRSELVNVTPDKLQAVVAFSIITLMLSLAFPRFTKARIEPQSMKENIIANSELVRGAGVIAQQNWDTLKDAPIFRYQKLYDESHTAKLEPDDQSAIARLNALNEERLKPSGDQPRPLKLRTITYHAACRKAIFHLEGLFSRCKEPSDRGYTLAWLNFAGKEYVEAVENADPVALLTLMHWGVLAERCSAGIWWAESIGESLVEEVTSAVGAKTDPVFKASVLWARGEVGLCPPEITNACNAQS